MANDLIVNGELVLYGPVGGDWWDGTGFTAVEVLQALAEMEGDITVRINSGGGIAWDGVAIYNAINARTDKVTMVVDGIAASAASVIAMGGDEIVMRTGALMMIHNASTITWGTAEDHEKSVNLLGKLDGQIASIYAARTGLDLAEIRALMDAETWMDPTEAAEKGFATRAAADKSAKASAFDYRLYAHAPKPLQSMARKLKAPEPDGAWGIPLNVASLARRKELAANAAKPEPAMTEKPEAAPPSADADAAPATERARIAAILNHAEAEERPKLAKHLAFETDMAPEAAAKLLAASAKEAPAAGGLADLTATAPAITLGADAKGKPADGGAKASWAKTIANVNKQRR